MRINGGSGHTWLDHPCQNPHPWHCPALTDIHDRAASPGKDVQNGDHGAAAETATAVVLR